MDQKTIDMLVKLRQEFELLAKLANRATIYEVEKGTGKRIRRSLRHVVVTECEATLVQLRAFIQENA